VIESNPHGLLGIPTANLPHETADLSRAFVVVEGPASAAGIDFIDHKQIEPASRFLRPFQDQPLGRRIAPSSIGFDRNGLLIEEQQYAVRR
jgi:hypothetical protein